MASQPQPTVKQLWQSLEELVSLVLTRCFPFCTRVAKHLAALAVWQAKPHSVVLIETTCCEEVTHQSFAESAFESWPSAKPSVAHECAFPLQSNICVHCGCFVLTCLSVQRLAGFLLKRKTSRSLTSGGWVKRWWVVALGNLSYYKDNKSTSKKFNVPLK